MTKEKIEASKEEDSDSGVKLAMITSHVSEDSIKEETLEQPKTAPKPKATNAAAATPKKKKQNLV